MSRRELLRWSASATVAALIPACAVPAPVAVVSPSPKPSSPEPTRRQVRAVCFDLFTLFDPRSMEGLVAAEVPADPAGFIEAWRTRQFQYAFLRAAADQYRDFELVTEDALLHTAASRKVVLSEAARKRLIQGYSELEPWPDARATLSEFRAAGLRLAPLANYAPGMLSRLLGRVEFTPFFEQLLSTDSARTFKPHRRAYALGTERLGLSPNEIVFAAFGGWDAAGAKWFGYPTFWVNRLGQSEEELSPGPDATGPALAGLAEFVRSRA